jgi:uncharacterized glyoxalase superfamily protein PhnB
MKRRVAKKTVRKHKKPVAKKRTAPKAKKVQPIPKGYHSVTPYLIVNGAANLIEFAKKAFGAKELQRHAMPDGKIAHAEIQIDDSRIMIADPLKETTTAMLHLYVKNVDAVYKTAIEAGATSVREPADQFYGDRGSGVKDPFGNTWWIATHIEDVTPAEIERRAKAKMQEHQQEQKPQEAPAAAPQPEPQPTSN